MNKKKLAETMNMADNKYDEEAENYEYKKKRPVWVKWGALAVCLCLMVCLFAIPRLLEMPNNGTSGDLSSMIYVNDTLYRVAGKQPEITGKEKQFVYLGIIASKVSS